MTQAIEAHSPARARGRSIASLFFAFFGTVWLSLSALALGRLSTAVMTCLFAIALVMIASAVWLLRVLPGGAAAPESNRGEGPHFGWVNAAQGVAIFLAFQVAHYFRRPDLAFPAMAIIVGLHFFALPRSMRHRSNIVTGALIAAAGALCPLLFHGDSMVAAVALCAGVTLWASAVWALMTALRVRDNIQKAPALFA